MDHLPERAECPAARVVQGATPGACGVVCGIMERDSRRADRILEGSPVGVFVSAENDPKTLANFCFGTAAPTPDPDTVVSHHTSCPVWIAGKEIDAQERTFKLHVPDTKPRDVPGVGPEPGTLTPEEAMLRG
jgi:hypothetical protein